MTANIFLSEEPYMSPTTKWLHTFVEDVAYSSINIMELISIFLILLTTVVAFYRLIKHKPFARVYLLHGQSIGLTFKLGAEILRTIPARTLDDIWQIFLLIVVKIMMGLLIEWELKGVEDPYSSDGFEHYAGQPMLFPMSRKKRAQMAAARKQHKQTQNQSTVQKAEKTLEDAVSQADL